MWLSIFKLIQYINKLLTSIINFIERNELQIVLSEQPREKAEKKPEALESFLTCFHSLMLENSVSLKKSIVSLQKLLNKINKRGNDT